MKVAASSTFRAAGVATLALSLSWVAPAQTLHAAPRPTLSPTKGPRVPNAKRASRITMPNGEVKVDQLGKEFQKWESALSYYDTPAHFYVHWGNNHSATDWARWEIYRKANNPQGRVVTASGKVQKPPTSPKQNTYFTIKPQEYLPIHNSGDTRTYYLTVTSRIASTGKLVRAKPTALKHLGKSSQRTPPKADPYACGTDPKQYARHVAFEIPQMTVNQTSSTSGDGDRDELYVTVGRLGPGTQSHQVRLPGADDYFEAHKHATVHPGGWTNQDQDVVAHPVAWQGTLRHGETVSLWITGAEQDNGDLKSMKEGVIAAMHGIAAVAGATGGAYGAIVAAAAETIAAGNQFVPDTDDHDFIAFAGLKATNRCGHIQTTWITFPSKSVAGIGTVSNEFVDVSTHNAIESRLAVLYAPKPGELQLYPYGVDYGGFSYAGSTDEFFWIAKGTSQAKYTFLLRARTWN